MSSRRSSRFNHRIEMNQTISHEPPERSPLVRTDPQNDFNLVSESPVTLLMDKKKHK